MEVGTAEESASANKSLRSAMAAVESNARVVRRRKIIVLSIDENKNDETTRHETADEPMMSRIRVDEPIDE